jgi:hypothetical protein
MLNNDYQHHHAAHCETGAMSLLLRHYGLDISEAMALGLSAGLTFVHVPLIRVGGFPLTAYRMWPGGIIRGLKKSLGFRMEMKRYATPQAGMEDLDAHLGEGKVVGLQTSVYWLPYFPPEMRFHFNAHNLVVYGKEGDEYLVSDPVFEHPVRCPSADLEKARFTKGVFAPRGLLYYPYQLPVQPELERPIEKAVHKTAFSMIRIPLPFMGVRGIRRLAAQLRKMSQSADVRYARLFVGNVIRMQEEIGTGGAGFRFMFGSFLQEASQITHREKYLEAADLMTMVGDLWREFALRGANFIRKRGENNLPGIADQLEACAAAEDKVFRLLLQK